MSNHLEDGMLTIRVTEIAEYLRGGELYSSLQTDETDAVLEVPSDCFRRGAKISNEAELEHLFKTLRFWIVRRIPSELLDYILSQETFDWTVFSTYEDDLPILTTVKSVVTAGDKLLQAFTLGSLDIVSYLHCRFGNPITKKAVEASARGGHLDCLKYAYEHGFQVLTTCLALSLLHKVVTWTVCSICSVGVASVPPIFATRRHSTAS